jgi:hypothetical protein
MSEEVEGLFSTISFVVDDKGFKKLEDYLFLASSAFSELNVKTEEYEDNLKRIAKSTRELGGLKFPKIPTSQPRAARPERPTQRPERPANDPLVGSLGRGLTRYGQPRARAGARGAKANFAGSFPELAGLSRIGGMATKLAPLAGSLGVVGLAITGISIAVKKVVSAFGRFAQKQATVINQSQILASSLGLQQSQILGLADAYKTLGLDSGNYLAAVKGVQGVQAGLAMGQSPEQQLMALAVGGVAGGAGALLSGDTDKLIELIGSQLKKLDAMGVNGKKQLAVLNTNFPELVKEARARDISRRQVGKDPAQIARELTATRLEGVEGGAEGLATKSAKLNLALAKLGATFDNFINLMMDNGLPVITNLVTWTNNFITGFKELSLEFADFITDIDKIKKLFSSLFDSLTEGFNDIIERVKHPFDAVVDKVSSAFTTPELAISASGFPTYRSPSNQTSNKNMTNNFNVTVHANGANAEEVGAVIKRELGKEIDQTAQSNSPLGN